MLAQQRVFRNQGRIRESDLLSTEAQMARGDADVSALQDQLVQARENLANLTGMEPDRELGLDDPATFPEYRGSLDDSVRRSTARWDVRAAYEAYRLAKDQTLAAEGGRLPSLAADGNYYLDRKGGSNPAKWDAMLSLQVPIFNLAGLEGKAREFRSKQRQAALALSQTLRQAKQEIREAFQAYQNSLKEDQAYQAALAATQKSHDAMARDYAHHLMNIVDYLKSVSDLQTAELNRAKSRTQWRIQRVWLGVATGEFPVTGVLEKAGETTAPATEVKP
jgi:outer membrane protein TolC